MPSWASAYDGTFEKSYFVNLEIKEAISVFEFVCFNYAHFDQSRME
jgi:hypothetical protein